MTGDDGSGSIAVTTTMDSDPERLRRIRWCHCGQPWLPAAGLYGTTEETECQACVLRRTAREKPAVAKARQAAFAAAVEECETYSKGAKSEEAKAVAMNLAVRITQRAKQ